jgi:PAS domain S-box-containing protein
MKKEMDRSAGASALRRRAEEQLQKKGPKDQTPATEAESQRLIHELQVHQIELELQNAELKEARNEAEAALAKCDDLFHFAPVGYFNLDRNRTIIDVNFAGANLLGLKRSMLIGRNFEVFVGPYSCPGFNSFLERVFAGNSKESCETLLTKEGNVQLSVQIEAVSANSGEECRVAVIDITERKRIEDKLHKSERQLSEAQRLAHVGSWEWDSVSDKVTGSDEFHSIFGLLIASYNSFLKQVHPEDREKVKKAVQETLDRKTLYDLHYRIMHPGGTARIIHALGEVRTDSAGRSIGMMGTVQDVTEQRQLEEKLESLNVELEAHAIQLEAANQELEAFNYSVSHDLRTYLNNIYGFSQVLLETYATRLDRQCRDFILHIKKAGEEMTQLINTLLDFSCLSHSGMSLEKVDLSSMATGIITDLRGASYDKRGRSVIQKGVDVVGDPNLLRIALTNLLSNAWKYSELKKEPIIEFGTLDNDGKNVCFVRDNGVGFDMSKAERLFTPFCRLHGKNEFSGHGIGLATAQRIISRHNGRIWAESEPGKGATFYFTLAD